MIKGSASMILGSILSRQVLASSTDIAQNVNMNEQKPFRFSAASEKFMSMFDLKFPIVQAPAGGGELVVQVEFGRPLRQRLEKERLVLDVSAGIERLHPAISLSARRTNSSRTGILKRLPDSALAPATAALALAAGSSRLPVRARSAALAR